MNVIKRAPHARTNARTDERTNEGSRATFLNVCIDNMYATTFRLVKYTHRPYVYARQRTVTVNTLVPQRIHPHADELKLTLQSEEGREGGREGREGGREGGRDGGREGREGGREGGRGGREGGREGGEGGGEGGEGGEEGRGEREGREVGMTVIHIIIGVFNSNPMIPQYLNNNLT